MKKILVTTAICLIGAASVMAQGRVNFANAGTTPLRINDGSITLNGDIRGITNSSTFSFIINPGATTRVLGTNSLATFGFGPASSLVRLYGGTESTSLSPILIGTTVTAGVPTPNFLAVTNSASLAAAPQGSFAGGTAIPMNGTYFLRFTCESMNGSYLGISSLIQVAGTVAPNPALALFSATPTANQWSGLTMYAIPEPSTFALAGLGAAAMLIFRRRK